jgi:hypothetical protein
LTELLGSRTARSASGTRMVYRQCDVCLGEAPIGGQWAPVRLRAEPGASPYRYRTAGLAHRHGHGPTTYLRARAYLATAAPRVVDQAGRRAGPPREIGIVRAWYAAEEQTLLLWECTPFPWCRETACHEDHLLATLWMGCERELPRWTPGVERILTPGRQRSYPTASWHAFLGAHGYQPLPGGAFAKMLARDGGIP